VGECIYILIDDDFNTWECSICREWWTLSNGIPEQNNMKFCPHCGAKIIKNKVETMEELIEKIQ
jgi:NAD-dependent SIR2 family protein deacetylase